jgi:hypothetical protein
MVELRQLTKNNLKDFLYLLNQRGIVNSEIEELIYSDFNFYGGFVAYLENIPVGSIGYVKRVLNDGSLKKICWFNDWFVNQDYRGFKIGKLLIEAVMTETGKACGVVSPIASKGIATSSGYLLSNLFYECKFPLSPIKNGFYKYKRNGLYSDYFFKRIVRCVYYKLFSRYNLGKNLNANIKFGKIKIPQYSISSNLNYLFIDKEYLNNVICVLETQRKNQLEFWTIEHDLFWSCGFIFCNSNNLRESVVLYSNNLCKLNAFKIYSEILRLFRKTQNIDQLNILLNKTVLKQFNLHKIFYKELPFMTHNLPIDSISFIHHIDKDSSWRF